MSESLCDDIPFLLLHALSGRVQLFPGANVAVVDEDVIVPMCAARIGFLLEMRDHQYRKLRKEGLSKFHAHLVAFFLGQKFAVIHVVSLYVVLVLQVSVILIDAEIRRYAPAFVAETVLIRIYTQHRREIGSGDKPVILPEIFSVLVRLIQQILHHLVRLRVTRFPDCLIDSHGVSVCPLSAGRCSS